MVQLEDYDNEGNVVMLKLDCTELPASQKGRKKKKKKKKKKDKDKKKSKGKAEKFKDKYDKYYIWFKDYQNYEKFGKITPTTVNNDINLDFVKGFKKIFICSICQDLVDKPANVKTCLHRFCQECIDTHLRVLKKECPCDRTPITNRRTLRPDKKVENALQLL